MLMPPISATGVLMAAISRATAYARYAGGIGGGPVVIPESAPEKTAPEPLRLVQRFVNSTEIHENRPDRRGARRAPRRCATGSWSAT